MVKGIEKFREYFAAHKEKFILIGGTACDLLMVAADLEFRATKDMDIVLIVEVLDQEFRNVFWDFIKQGKYENIQKSTGKKEFYRFYNPTDDSFPYMLEFFARKPDMLEIPEDRILTAIPVDEEISSLSAILLNDDYYKFILDGVKVIDGLPVIDTEYLIPLKAKAFLDLNERKTKGEQVDSKDIKKHKNDIFRLYNILSPDMRIVLPRIINADLLAFMDEVKQEPIALKAFGITGRSFLEVLQDLSDIYQLENSHWK